MAIPFIFPYAKIGSPIISDATMPPTIPVGLIFSPFSVKTVGSRVAALSVPYIRNRCVTVSLGIFAIKIPATRSKTIPHFVFLIPPPDVFPVCRSVIRDAQAHKLLSIVDRRPEIIINKNGTTTHAGNNLLINSKLIIPVSAAAYPLPAPINPRIPMERGTTPKSNAPTKNARPILFFFTQNARCQKHWSPNGPEINPTVVGRPKPRNISTPFEDTSDLESPAIPPQVRQSVFLFLHRFVFRILQNICWRSA